MRQSLTGRWLHVHFLIHTKHTLYVYVHVYKYIEWTFIYLLSTFSIFSDLIFICIVYIHIILKIEYKKSLVLTHKVKGHRFYTVIP